MMQTCACFGKLSEDLNVAYFEAGTCHAERVGEETGSDVLCCDVKSGTVSEDGSEQVLGIELLPSSCITSSIYQRLVRARIAVKPRRVCNKASDLAVGSR